MLKRQNVLLENLAAGVVPPVCFWSRSSEVLANLQNRNMRQVGEILALSRAQQRELARDLVLISVDPVCNQLGKYVLAISNVASRCADSREGGSDQFARQVWQAAQNEIKKILSLSETQLQVDILL